VNESRRLRNRTLQRILLARPKFLQKVVRAFSPEKLRHGLLNLAFRFNAPAARRPALHPNTRQELNAYFAADIRELSDLTGRDLSLWSAPKAEETLVRERAPVAA
jgi:hypothetical protein